MNIQVTARHFKASAQLQADIQSAMDEMEKYSERFSHCHVIMDAEHKDRQSVEITIGARGKTLVSKAESDQMSKAAAMALEKTERQLQKLMSKKHDHRVSGRGPKPATEEEEEETEETI